MLRQRKRNRLRGFNYTQNRLYSITTCVHGMICAFGDVVAHRMILNQCGMIADRQWHWLENQYPYVRVHTYIIMPNHVHAILEINDRWDMQDHDAPMDKDAPLDKDASLDNDAPLDNDASLDKDVRTGRDLSVHLYPRGELLYPRGELLDPQEELPEKADHDPNAIPKMKIKSLSELIGAYKTTSSKQIHQIRDQDGSYPHLSFRWHRSFHDRIIRNQWEYHRIAGYIKQNPRKWTKDEFHV